MVFVYLLGLLLSSRAQTTGTLTASAHADPPPVELAAPVREKISPGGVRATANGITLTFWWVKELPLTAPSWAGVAEGTLVGAVKVERDYRDIRGKVIKPGVYTLRYGIQPANGDHLGVSPFRDFLLLSPAAVDGTAAPQGHDGTVDLSKQTIGGSHPAVWSIDPPVATEAPLSIHTTDLGHKAVVVELAGIRDGKPEPMRFGLVLVGRIEA
jgi:hypothetical protein